MGFKLGEVIADAAIAKLKAGMDARVAEINVEKNDAVVLKPPQDSDYYVGGVNELPRAPAIIVTEGAGDFTGDGPSSWLLDDELIVFIVEEDSDRQRLARRLWRQERAVLSCLLLDLPAEQLDGSAYTLRPKARVAGRVFEPTEDQVNWRAYRIVVFSAVQAEN